MKLEPRLESEPEQFFEHGACCLNCVIYVFYKSMCQVLIVMLGLTIQQGYWYWTHFDYKRSPYLIELYSC